MIRRIGLDMDGVLVDWFGYVGRIMARELGRDYEAWYKEITYGFLQADPEAKAIYVRHIKDVFTKSLPMPGAVRAASQLRNLCQEVHIVTGGPSNSRAWKQGWLDRHAVSYAEFHLLDVKQPKSMVRCDLYIDDSPHVADELIMHTDAQVILFDAPYNVGEKAPKTEGNIRLHRARGWNEVLEITSRIAVAGIAEPLNAVTPR